MFRCRSGFCISLFIVNISRYSFFLWFQGTAFFPFCSSVLHVAAQPYRFHEWPCEWYPLPACPCVSCFVAVLGFTLVCLLLIYQGIRLLLWFQGTAFFPFSIRSAFCMRLLNSIHDEVGSRSFACWFCLDFSLEIAVQTNRSKGKIRMSEGDRRKEVCRLFGRQKPTRYAYS